MGTQKSPPRLEAASYFVKRSYFVTFCVFRRAPAFADPPAAADARETILSYRERGFYYLPSYCVMPDHIHLLIIPLCPTRHLSRIVATLKNAIASRFRRRGSHVKWQFGYHDRILRRSESTSDISTYIMMNPVRKGLVADYRDWPYSGIVDRWF